MELEYYGIKDIGKKRENQEDNILINKNLNLFIVADGMGGHNAGEVASKMAVTLIEKYIKMNSIKKFIPENLIENGIISANREIYKASLQNSNRKGMGTTVILLFFYKDKYYIANVGDSRAYLFRYNTLIQLSEDHSLVYEQYKMGLMKREDMEKSPYKNIITRAVGIDPNVKIDIYKDEFEKDDIFLLCSDGLYNEVSDSEIKSILKNNFPLQTLGKQLIEKANNNGGNDNISLILIKVLKE